MRAIQTIQKAGSSPELRYPKFSKSNIKSRKMFSVGVRLKVSLNAAKGNKINASTRQKNPTQWINIPKLVILRERFNFNFERIYVL